MIELIKKIAASTGDVEYRPYSMEDVIVSVGAPPTILNGVDFVAAYRNEPKAKMFNCFTQVGAFVSNRNLKGYIEIGVMRESSAEAALRVIDATGVNFPIYCSDRGTNGSSFFASSRARIVNTPMWRKSANHDTTVFMLEASRLLITGGIREIL